LNVANPRAVLRITLRQPREAVINIAIEMEVVQVLNEAS